MGVSVLLGLLVAVTAPPPCTMCASWNVSQAPFRIYGNTYYVGVHGLSAVLVTSDAGHVLVDTALPESAVKIADNIRALGFRIEDVKLIVGSHVHFDHAGGMAALQRLSGARVVASSKSAPVLRRGSSGPDDPQYGLALPIGKIAHVDEIGDGEVVRVGPLELTAHATPGHTPGGTSWSWNSCAGQRCLAVVYADSLTPVSADDFRFTDTKKHPNALADFAKSFTTLASLPCDVLLTPHPEMVDLWERLGKREHGDADALVDRDACSRYVASARQRLDKRIASERAAHASAQPE